MYQNNRVVSKSEQLTELDFDEAINLRLNDKNWSNHIAGQVIAERSAQRRRLFALAAMLFVISSMAVFTTSDLWNPGPGEVAATDLEIQEYNEEDELIDDIFAARWGME